jgi:hypothetical protein
MIPNEYGIIKPTYLEGNAMRTISRARSASERRVSGPEAFSRRWLLFRDLNFPGSRIFLR